MSTEETTEGAADPYKQPGERGQVEPITPQRVADIFTEEGLEHRVDEEVRAVRSGFVNAAIVVALDGAHLVFEAIWRGSVPKDMASHLLFAVNEYNQTHFAPTLRMFEAEDDTLAVSAIRTMDADVGASFNQLGTFIVTSITAVLEAFNYLETTFPTLVTWENPHHEH